MSERTKLVIEAKNFPRLLETEFFNTIGHKETFKNDSLELPRGVQHP